MMPATNLFVKTLVEMWCDSIQAVGNYDTMYEKNLGGGFAREGLNLLNDDSSPQLCATAGTVR